MDLTLRQDSKTTVANSLLATTYLGPKMDLEVKPVVFEYCSYSYLPHEKIINSVTYSGVKYWVENVGKYDHQGNEIFSKYVSLD